jgi:hypothetical protein
VAKPPRAEWREILRPLLHEAGTQAARWAPRAAAGLEDGLREAARRYRRRRQQAAAEFRPHKGRLLWLLPLPLIPAAVLALTTGQVGTLAAISAAYGLYLAGAMLARRGFQDEAEYHRRRLASAPWPPFKTLAALAIALATLVTAWLGAGHTIAAGMAFGLGAFVAFVLLYGLEPRRGKTVPERVGVDSEEAGRLLAQAEQKVTAIEQAGQRIGHPELRARLGRIASLARDILHEIEHDPANLRRARRFLTTYLDGAQRVVTGYADTHSQGGPHQLEDNFRRVLATIEEVFEAQYTRLQETDLRELDVQIEVLETQLKREGF